MSYQVLIMIADPTMVGTKLLNEFENLSSYNILTDCDAPTILVKGGFGEAMVEVATLDVGLFQADFLEEHKARFSDSDLVRVQGRFEYLTTAVMYLMGRLFDYDGQEITVE